MRDYTTNNYCDFLWISDLIELKQNQQNKYTLTVKDKNTTTSVNIVNVVIFGTIVEIKQIAAKGFLYHVDDGTGVIACKHSTEQFEEVISFIESEHYDILNQTFQCKNTSELSMMSEQSMDDSVFNDRSTLSIEDNKKTQLMGLQSLWDDVYESFTNLTTQYNIGDVVLIEGKMYSYFKSNQIYVNCIRSMNHSEEVTKVSLKLEHSQDPQPPEKTDNEKRLSGLMTFDHIHHMSAPFPSSRDIRTPKQAVPVLNEKVVTPQLESVITFDTFNSED